MKLKKINKTLLVGIGFFTLFVASKVQAKNKLQIEILDGNGAKIEKVCLHPKDEVVHIFGSGQRHKSLQMSIGAHTDVQLVDPSGDVVEERTKLIPLAPPRLDLRTRRFTYGVNVKELSQASLVRVIYRPYPHRDCSE